MMFVIFLSCKLLEPLFVYLFIPSDRLHPNYLTIHFPIPFSTITQLQEIAFLV
jgi:hypothetical protein